MKKTKKTKIYVSALAAIAVYSAVSIALNFNFQKPEEARQKVSDWVRENIVSADVYRFELTLHTVNERYFDVDFHEGDAEVLAEKPATSDERFIVTVNRKDKTAKIEWVYSDLMYTERIKNSYAEEHSGLVYYLALTDGAVQFYYPKDGVYRTEIYREPRYYTLIDLALFSDKLSVLDGEIISHKRSFHSIYGAMRTVQSINIMLNPQLFYEAFGLTPGSADSQLRAYVELDISWFKNRQTDTLDISFSGIEPLFAAAYEVFTESAYENAFTRAGYGYNLSAQAHFYQYNNKPEAFELPPADATDF